MIDPHFIAFIRAAAKAILCCFCGVSEFMRPKTSSCRPSLSTLSITATATYGKKLMDVLAKEKTSARTPGVLRGQTHISSRFGVCIEAWSQTSIHVELGKSKVSRTGALMISSRGVRATLTQTGKQECQGKILTQWEMRT